MISVIKNNKNEDAINTEETLSFKSDVIAKTRIGPTLLKGMVIILVFRRLEVALHNRSKLIV